MQSHLPERNATAGDRAFVEIFTGIVTFSCSHTAADHYSTLKLNELLKSVLLDQKRRIKMAQHKIGLLRRIHRTLGTGPR